MKLISKAELNQVSGGVINYNGHSIYVDTTGIPSRCVGEIEGTMNTIIQMAAIPNVTASMLMNAMGPHMDMMIASGCDAYLDLYRARVEALKSRYA